MEEILSDPCAVKEGVAFEVTVESACRECVVTMEALAHLRRMHGFSMDLMHVYRAFEARIHSVARRLVFSGVHASPLVLEPHCFH